MSIIASLLVIFAYLLGSVSSAVLFCRLAGLPDPRESGSNNPGATNVLRIGGKLSALGVLLADILKGIFPVSLGFYLQQSTTVIGMIALATCLGHIFPIFFRFKGGKGVATALGVVIGISHFIGDLIFATWISVLLISGYSSLAAVVSALVAPFYMWWISPEFTFPIALVCCLLVYRHHDNIQRLWRGQESRVWRKNRHNQH